MPPYAEGRVHTYVVAMAKISRIASQKRPFSLNSQCGRCIIPGRAFRMHGRGSQFGKFLPKRAPRNALPARQNTSGATRLARRGKRMVQPSLLTGRKTNGIVRHAGRLEDERYNSSCRQAENGWRSLLGWQAGKRVVQFPWRTGWETSGAARFGRIVPNRVLCTDSERRSLFTYFATWCFVARVMACAGCGRQNLYIKRDLRQFDRKPGVRKMDRCAQGRRCCSMALRPRPCQGWRRLAAYSPVFERSCSRRAFNTARFLACFSA